MVYMKTSVAAQSSSGLVWSLVSIFLLIKICLSHPNLSPSSIFSVPTLLTHHALPFPPHTPLPPLSYFPLLSLYPSPAFLSCNLPLPLSTPVKTECGYGKDKNSTARGIRSKPWCHHFVEVCPWACCLASVSLGFLVC